MQDWMDNKEEGSLAVEIVRHIAFVNFSHPDHNSLPSSLLAAITEAIQSLGNDLDVKAIVIKSSGDRTFCAGANFDELASINDFASGTAFFMGFANVINALRTCSKLVIGRVQGKAVGGGVGLLSAFDYCLATKWSSVKLSEISLGIGPFVIEPALRRKIGLSAFSQLALHPSAWQDASWAGNHGMFHQVHESIELMDEQLEIYLDQLRQYDLVALRQMKGVLWEGTGHWDELLKGRAQKSARLLLSETTQTNLRGLMTKK